MEPTPDIQAINKQLEELNSVWTKHNQGHVFQWADKLKNEEKLTFLEDLQQVDIADVERTYKEAVAHEAKNAATKCEVRPFASVTKFSDVSKEQRSRWEQIGLSLIAENKVAVLLLAGGQATRLGCTFPKGMYDIGLPSKKSLYQLQVERAARLQKMAARSRGKQTCTIAWYIMTSPATYEGTMNFFRGNRFFGQDPSNFFFFNQHMQPCLTPEGKVISESAGRVALAPNGNGGLYKALLTSGALADMTRRGVEYVAQYCVDNVLIKTADPVFVGFMHEMRADCAAKVVPKAYPEEPVGVMALMDGRPGVIEYSEIDPALRVLRDDSGDLVYNFSHICINNFTRQFLQDIAEHHVNKLRFHIARKKIPEANEAGVRTDPPKENGWKLEMFIFDTFSFSKKMVALEVNREEEFSPLKNKEGAPKDSPETCKADICRLHTKYVVKAGGSVLVDPKADAKIPPVVEISSLISYAGEDIEAFVKNVTFSAPVEIKGNLDLSLTARE